jgi:hypothetical protein
MQQCGSDCLSEFIEGSRDTELRWSIAGEFVVAAADVLDEGMSRDDGPCAGVGLHAAYEPQPSLDRRGRLRAEPRLLEQAQNLLTDLGERAAPVTF